MSEGNENDPEQWAKLGHEYFRQKRFMKAFKELRKIPKSLLETESYKEAKKELKYVKRFYLCATFGL